MAVSIQLQPGQSGARSAPSRRFLGERIASAKPGLAPYVHDVAVIYPWPQIHVGVQSRVVIHPPGRRVRTRERIRRQEKKRPDDGEFADHSPSGDAACSPRTSGGGGGGLLQISIQVGGPEKAAPAICAAFRPDPPPQPDTATAHRTKSRARFIGIFVIMGFSFEILQNPICFRRTKSTRTATLSENIHRCGGSSGPRSLEHSVAAPPERRWCPASGRLPPPPPDNANPLVGFIFHFTKTFYLLRSHIFIFMLLWCIIAF